jgi:hypothetical protein
MKRLRAPYILLERRPDSTSQSSPASTGFVSAPSFSTSTVTTSPGFR